MDWEKIDAKTTIGIGARRVQLALREYDAQHRAECHAQPEPQDAAPRPIQVGDQVEYDNTDEPAWYGKRGVVVPHADDYHGRLVDVKCEQGMWPHSDMVASFRPCNLRILSRPEKPKDDVPGPIRKNDRLEYIAGNEYAILSLVGTRFVALEDDDFVTPQVRVQRENAPVDPINIYRANLRIIPRRPKDVDWAPGDKVKGSFTGRSYILLERRDKGGWWTVTADEEGHPRVTQDATSFLEYVAPGPNHGKE